MVLGRGGWRQAESLYRGQDGAAASAAQPHIHARCGHRPNPENRRQHLAQRQKNRSGADDHWRSRQLLRAPQAGGQPSHHPKTGSGRNDRDGQSGPRQPDSPHRARMDSAHPNHQPHRHANRAGDGVAGLFREKLIFNLEGISNDSQ